MKLAVAGFMGALIVAVVATGGPTTALDRISGFFGLGVLFVFFALIFFLMLFSAAVFERPLGFLWSQPWDETLPKRWAHRKEDSSGKYVLKLILSVTLFFLAFLIYLSVMVTFFYLAGPPFSSQLGYLMVASLSAVALVRLERYLPGESHSRAAKALFDFLLPFGLIVAFILFGVGNVFPLGW